MSKPKWEMTVPVISTGHVPNRHFAGVLGKKLAELFKGDSWSPYGLLLETYGGCILYMGIGKEAWPEWFLPIANWFEAEYPDEFWLRIDPDGDYIEELPRYEW